MKEPIKLKAFPAKDTTAKITLERLPEIVPGYVNLCVNDCSACWYFSVGNIHKQTKEIRGATILRLVPIQPYTLEVTIEREGDK